MFETQGSVWGQTEVKLEAITKLLEENYEKYKTALEKAVVKNLIIKM